MKVLVTGGAGFVGSVLVQRLLQAGHEVTVYDLFLYNKPTEWFQHFAAIPPVPMMVQGDIRDTLYLAETIDGHEAVIHLACIANDPSFDLDPELGKSINYDCFPSLIQACVFAGVKRFLYASSSSVYGISESEKVTEDHPCKPMTDYARFKLACEDMLLSEPADGPMAYTILRPGTVCGPSPRMRFDLTVNGFVKDAMTQGEIVVAGGKQTRANIHMEDMADCYLKLLEAPVKEISGQVYNVGWFNATVRSLAEMVAGEVDHAIGDVKHPPVKIREVPSNDARSYRVCSDKFKEQFAFKPRAIADAAEQVIRGFQAGRFPHAQRDDCYYGVRRLKNKVEQLKKAQEVA